MAEVQLSLGTNIGNRYRNLQQALDNLRQICEVTKVSNIYETEPWGFEDQPNFLNLCAVARSDLEPRELLREIKSIEKRMGREKGTHWGPRLIDIDLLFYDSLVMKTDDLELPHPQIEQRAFVLVPLAEIMPSYVHPTLDHSIQELVEKIDKTGVRLVDPSEGDSKD